MSFMFNSHARNMQLDAVTHKQSELLFHALFMIDWPAPHKTALNMCAITANTQSLAHKLATKEGLRSKQHPINIHFITDIRTALSFDRENICDIFYFDPILSKFNFSAMAELSYSRAILLIGHGDLFIEQGGMLSFMGERPETTTLYASTQFRHARLLTVDPILLNHVQAR